ncbi:venom serine carboxypeptidase-like [Dermacentor albipictus]|uniref:venom serine carboxypeptidase-like n=1 Tax=Dermacentor albipictus TaxID=60249 RepID=UPI0031FE29A6
MKTALGLLLCSIAFSSSVCEKHDYGHKKLSRRYITAANEGSRSSEDEDVGEPLFLTPLIEAGKYEEALQKSRVGKIGDVPDVTSYSGFITVDKELGNHLFFWFFPASENSESAPVSMWLQGGPGTSSLEGLFVEHGPYFIDENGDPQMRDLTWTRIISMLYIDNPAGTGFSFTESEDGYATNQDDVSRDMLELLQQFFTLFSGYASNDFYMSGESYGGKFVPSIGAALHESKDKLRVPINFKGIAIGNGMTDPITMLLYGDFLYYIGLMDKQQARHMQNECDRAAILIREGNYVEATVLTTSLILGTVAGQTTYFGNVTGYEYCYNYLMTQKPEPQTRFKYFVDTPTVRKAIHVGQIPFEGGSSDVMVHFAADLMKSVKERLTVLVENYKVLVYNGHLDIIVPYTATQAMMDSLQWSGSEEWSNAERKIWRSHDGQHIHGYAKNVRNCTLVLVRDAGHILPYDQPEAAYDMITRFIHEEPFAA